MTANYNGGAVEYTYGYDVAGNLVNNNGTMRTYNATNQMVNDGTNTLSYDNNGNLTGDGVNAYTWDRANRLLSVGNHSYVYNGLGNRVQQTVSSVVTDYLNDVQPGLVKLLRQNDGSNVEHFIHAPRGIHAMYDGTDWNWYMQDGLGSVRGLVDDAAVVKNSMAYDPYGNPMGSYGAGFGFTGEQTGENGSVFLRARYYEPSLAVFPSLDPFEGLMQRPMSLNGYSWVEGKVPNAVDPSGMQTCPTQCSNPSYYIINSNDSFFTRFLKRQRRFQCEILGCEKLYADYTVFVTPTPDPFSVPVSTSTPDMIICPTPSNTSTPVPTNTPTGIPSPTYTPSPWPSPTSSTGSSLYPIFGEGPCQVTTQMGVKRFTNDHQARDIVPIGAFTDPNNQFLNPSWDTQIVTQDVNILHAVADGTILDLGSSTFILMSDLNGDSVEDTWFQYRHAQLSVPSNTTVNKGDVIGSIVNYTLDQSAGNETHLDFAIILRPQGVSVDPFGSEYFPNSIQADNFSTQIALCNASRG